MHTLDEVQWYWVLRQEWDLWRTNLLTSAAPNPALAMHTKAAAGKKLTNMWWERAGELQKYELWPVTVPCSWLFFDSINWKLHPIWRCFCFYKIISSAKPTSSRMFLIVSKLFFLISAMSIWSSANDVNGIFFDLSVRVNVSKELEKILSVLIIVTAGAITSQTTTDNHCLLEKTEENYLWVEIVTVFCQL